MRSSFLKLDIYLNWHIIKNMNGKQIIKKLEAVGWRMVRIQGSHHQLINGRKKTTVPVHGTKDLGKGLVASIERETGVKLS